MHTLLLLAGRSTRFWPLSEKMLVRINGKTLLETQMQRLRDAGCDRITMVVGSHNQAAMRAMFPDVPMVEQDDLSLGTRGALLSALPAFGSEPVLIACGNDVVDLGAYQSILAAMQHGADGALLAQRRASYFPGGYLTVVDGRAVSIVEKPGAGREPSDLVNIEVHAHGNASVLLQALHTVTNVRDDGYEQALQSLFAQHSYSVVPYEGYWQAVKYPWHLLQLLPQILDNIRSSSIAPSANIHPSAVLEGSVVLCDGVKVFPHATIRGPCWIGPNTIIANNALVRGASIGADCVIGYNTEVKSSILSDHVWTHSTYVGDSVVARNVSFGAGCVTGNLRLDEGTIHSSVHDEPIDSQLQKFGTIIGDNTRVGIHVGINPGVKIGGGTFIAGGSFVTDDVPDGSFVRMKNGTAIATPNRDAVPEPAARTSFRNHVEKKLPL